MLLRPQNNTGGIKNVLFIQHNLSLLPNKPCQNIVAYCPYRSAGWFYSSAQLGFVRVSVIRKELAGLAWPHMVIQYSVSCGLSLSQWTWPK